MSSSLHRQFILHSDSNAQLLYIFLRANWKAMADMGKPLTVTVTAYKEKRTPDQNKRYWALLHDIADNAWLNGRQFSAEAWAEYYKGRLIGYEETPDGRQIGISTTTLDIVEFSDYLTQIEAHATTELGLLETA